MRAVEDYIVIYSGRDESGSWNPYPQETNIDNAEYVNENATVRNKTYSSSERARIWYK